MEESMGRYVVKVGPIAVALALGVTALLFCGEGARAEQGAAVAISVKDHRFQPAEIHAPANRPLAIRVKNLDQAAMEFESVSLRVEKVIVPGGEGVVNIRPLAPGKYEFFDDFHQQTRGTLVVE
jgi:heme/copper-type cytochrome/quinol oxidase subunit 2